MAPLSSLDADAERLAALILGAGRGGTVVFTGAGVSTESGMPDFAVQAVCGRAMRRLATRSS